VAWMWSVFTWRKSQAAQRTQNEFTRKEGLYRELLRTVTVFYGDGATTGVAPFLEQYRLAWLYAPDDVVELLVSLAESLQLDPAEKHMTQEQQQKFRVDRDTLGGQKIALLVAAIRRDLFETAGKKTALAAGDFRHYR